MDAQLLNLATRMSRGTFKSSMECLSHMLSLAQTPAGFAELLQPLQSEYKAISCPPHADERTKQAAYERVLGYITHPLLRTKLLGFQKLASKLACCDDAATRFALTCVLEERLSGNVLQHLVLQDAIVYRRPEYLHFDRDCSFYIAVQVPRRVQLAESATQTVHTAQDTAPAPPALNSAQYQLWQGTAEHLAALSAGAAEYMRQETQFVEAELLSQCCYLSYRLSELSSRAAEAQRRASVESESTDAAEIGKDAADERLQDACFDYQKHATTFPGCLDSNGTAQLGDAAGPEGAFDAALTAPPPRPHCARDEALTNELRDKCAEAEARAAELAQKNLDLEGSKNALAQQLKEMAASFDEMQRTCEALRRENARAAGEKRALEQRLTQQTGLYDGIFAKMESVGRSYNELARSRASRASRQ